MHIHDYALAAYLEKNCNLLSDPDSLKIKKKNLQSTAKCNDKQVSSNNE